MQVQEEKINATKMGEHNKHDGENSSDDVTSGQDRVDMNTNFAGIVNRRPIIEPQNGLEFESKEAAYSFYREYARSVGFSITIKASRRSKISGKFIDIKVACSRFGSRRESTKAINLRPGIKTDCKAGMHMKKKPDGKWIIYSFTKEHNHEICPDDLFKGRNKQPGTVVAKKKGPQLALNEGDLKLLTEYFICMQDENPGFFYAIDLDHHRQLRSVFWVDSKGRHDYINFHDVVFFDTFFLKNKYKVPFVPIFGVNHHFQYILFGSALIREETISAFVWLMQIWLKAMGGQAPKVVITDQDKILKEAVADVFPETCHCFSLWHVLTKVPENLGYVTNQHESFIEKFNKCIYQSWSYEQFEKRWWKLVDRFELRTDEWVQSLYEDRERWIPSCMRGVFLAGMSTAERSGSVASYLDKFLHMESTFVEFIERYKIFSENRHEIEAKADFETQLNLPVLRSPLPFEKQMSTIYTDTIFRKFQVEILGVMSCHLQKQREERGTVVFSVDDFEEHQKFIVAWNKAESDICCSCYSFEYRGVLCRHAILVFQLSGISSIPSRYILKRWTKDAKAIQFGGDIKKGDPNRMLRFNDLCRQAVILSEVGSLSKENYRIAFDALEEVYYRCVKVNNSAAAISEPNTSALFLEAGNVNYGNHIKSNKNKNTYKKKGCSEPERTAKRMPDNFQQLQQISPGADILDNCNIPQHDMQEELSSRTQTLDGYYVSEHSMHGQGQLNLISPTRNDYHSYQQATPGLVGQAQFALN